MQIQPRDERLLDFAFEHYVFTLDHAHRHVFTANTDTRVVRRRLNLMLAEGLLAVTRAQVLTARNNVHVPCYYATEKAARLMCQRTGQLHYLLAPTREPYTKHLAHFIALTDLRILIKKAAAHAAPLYTLESYYNQFDVANAATLDPSEHFKLYTTIERTPKPIYCVPDWAMAFRSGSYLMAMYGELERESTGVASAARKKSPGFAGLYEKQLHKKHFPGALDEFRVLVIALHSAWRDRLLIEFAQKPHAELYRFAALEELTEETFFFESVWRSCDGSAEPLFRVRPGPAPAREVDQNRTPHLVSKE